MLVKYYIHMYLCSYYILKCQSHSTMREYGQDERNNCGFRASLSTFKKGNSTIFEIWKIVGQDKILFRRFYKNKMKLIFGEARKPCPYFSSRALIEPCFKMSVFRKKLIACHIYDIYDTYPQQVLKMHIVLYKLKSSA